jgi:hypothetical protein
MITYKNKIIPVDYYLWGRKAVSVRLLNLDGIHLINNSYFCLEN